MDIQEKLRTGRDAGDERWARGFNLKQMAQTLNYLTEHGLLEYGALSEKTAAATARFNGLSGQIKEAEKRLAEIAILRTYIINYSKTRDVYVAYRKAGYSKKFKAELLLHQTAKKAFDELGVKKLPTVRSLQAEYAALLAEKKEAYGDYRKARDEMKELLTVKANVDRLMGYDEKRGEWKPLKILSCGAGVQSTALALMSCENVLRGKTVHPDVPVYDAILFCDLGAEPAWVYAQAAFLQKVCKAAGIPFYILHTNLYGDYLQNFGRGHFSNIPWWTLREDGKRGKLRRCCTLDYKIIRMRQFVKYELLGYRRGQRLNPWDAGAHEMHIGFSAEEKQWIFDSRHPLFQNRFPLANMGWIRREAYGYTLEVWGLATRASACVFCPFHRNYFFQRLKEDDPDRYAQVLEMELALETRQRDTMIQSPVFMSYSCKWVWDGF